MKFFLDSANLEEVLSAKSMGFLAGVTTNPSLMAKNRKQNDKSFVKDMADACEDMPLSIEVIAEEYNEMIKEAEEISSIANNICVKIPITMDGVKLCKHLSSNNIMTNMTLCFSPIQALVVARVGATYVSPFIGRLDDVAIDGMQLIEDIRTIYDNQSDIETQILAASVRHPMHLLNAAKLGADVVTIPYDVYKNLVAHPFTDMGIAKFISDYKNTNLKVSKKEDPVE